MTDLADFLRARYTETRQREQAKRMVVPSVFDDHDVEWRYNLGEPETLYVNGHPYPAEEYTEIATRPAPDPDVIADLDVKLALLDEHEPGGRYWPDSPRQYCKTCGSGEPNEYPTDWPCPTLRILARPFAGHPGYQEDWAT
ncbi:DUF6221 family protein [Streptomyces sp. C3-3]|uniref:DUF6221 family protein n=1 Tax=Streptomyces sp. C3-3 TaxID=2824901 RepID=UPI001B36A8AB|nr:DUF6221 family protein [Streptomyces sp. C3-3]MBQ1118339.1 hypothetical protein [Streptomyces sp. C3-3]